MTLASKNNHPVEVGDLRSWRREIQIIDPEPAFRASSSLLLVSVPSPAVVRPAAVSPAKPIPDIRQEELCPPPTRPSTRLKNILSYLLNLWHVNVSFPAFKGSKLLSYHNKVYFLFSYQTIIKAIQRMNLDIFLVNN